MMEKARWLPACKLPLVELETVVLNSDLEALNKLLSEHGATILFKREVRHLVPFQLDY